MKRSPVILRLLAPIAVAGLAVVVFLVVASSLPDSDSDDKRREGRGGQKSQQQAKSDEKFYTVEPGDTLTTIRYARERFYTTDQPDLAASEALAGLAR